MKLLHYTTRSFFISMMLILALTGALLYVMLRELVEEEMLEQLDLQAQMIAEELHRGKAISYPLVEITRITPEVVRKPIVGDTLVYDYLLKQDEDYKYLLTDKQAGGDAYRIKVMTTYIGWSNYSKTIFIFLSGAAFLFILAGVLLNQVLNRRLWAPFFFNLRQLNTYSLSRDEAVPFKSSPITEFSEMTETLEKLTERSRREYRALREFTENASHEIQTPLGIIQSKLDRLSQMQQVDENISTLIVQARTAVERLRRVNRSLLLLAKLDNNAYAQKERVQADELVRQQYEHMEELFEGRKVTVILHLQPVQTSCNRYLAEVLVSNLFANALHYTPESGVFMVSVAAGMLIFENTGPALTFPPEELFDRFKKGDQHSQSTGLGLSIIKQICVVNSWDIQYHYQEGRHRFCIQLEKPF